jgi:predicted nucleic acid-binding protein
VSAVVVDASAVVAALTDASTSGGWARDRMENADLVAPHVMPFEVATVLRRAELAGAISPDVASLAHADLLDLPVGLWAYEGSHRWRGSCGTT